MTTFYVPEHGSAVPDSPHLSEQPEPYVTASISLTVVAGFPPTLPKMKVVVLERSPFLSTIAARGIGAVVRTGSRFASLRCEFWPR